MSPLSISPHLTKQDIIVRMAAALYARIGFFNSLVYFFLRRNPCNQKLLIALPFPIYNSRSLKYIFYFPFILRIRINSGKQLVIYAKPKEKPVVESASSHMNPETHMQ